VGPIPGKRSAAGESAAEADPRATRVPPGRRAPCRWLQGRPPLGAQSWSCCFALPTLPCCSSRSAFFSIIDRVGYISGLHARTIIRERCSPPRRTRAGQHVSLAEIRGHRLGGSRCFSQAFNIGLFSLVFHGAAQRHSGAPCSFLLWCDFPFLDLGDHPDDRLDSVFFGPQTARLQPAAAGSRPITFATARVPAVLRFSAVIVHLTWHLYTLLMVAPDRETSLVQDRGPALLEGGAAIAGGVAAWRAMVKWSSSPLSKTGIALRLRSWSSPRCMGDYFVVKQDERRPRAPRFVSALSDPRSQAMAIFRPALGPSRDDPG